MAVRGLSQGRSMGRRLALALDDVLEPASPQTVAWRSLGVLFIAAGVIVSCTLLIGLPAGAGDEVVVALAALCLIGGSSQVVLAHVIPERWLGWVLATGLSMVSLGVLAYGSATTPYVLFYIWISVESFFFLRGRHAVLMSGAAVALSAAVMSHLGWDGEAGLWWATILGSNITLAGLAGIMHGRSQRLIDRLAKAARHDALTGLLNRRGYQQRLDEELARARRHETPLAIVLGDLDNFKALNDSFGHRQGDAALERFAALCREHVREIDFVSRVGGEEFAIVLPETDAHGAVLVAERLRRSVRLALRTPDGKPVSASFGVAAYPEHGREAESLLDHADQAMYAAKALGRDRTVVFADDLPVREDAERREHLQAVLLLAETLDLRDAGTSAHSHTVGRLCEAVAGRLGLECARVERLRLAGQLHDIGKVGVPDDVLRKEGPLTDAEWAEMRKHPELGARLLSGAGLEDIAQWVLAHHERPNGRGYPFGLAGSQIPLEARILSAADAYEAMTADRPYRKAPGNHFAREQLRAGAGSQFDAEVVEALLAVVG